MQVTIKDEGKILTFGDLDQGDLFKFADTESFRPELCMKHDEGGWITLDDSQDNAGFLVTRQDDDVEVIQYVVVSPMVVEPVK